MKLKSRLKTAHSDTVNSIFLNLEAGVVIGLDENSIKVWDPVKGVEISVFDRNENDDSLMLGMNAIYRTV